MSADITEQSAPEPTTEVTQNEPGGRIVHRGNGRDNMHRSNRNTYGSVWRHMTATAYTADCLGCIGITKTGVDVRRQITHGGRRVIAVDPSVIPLSSAVEIRLADGRIIEATAQDTGGAIKNRRIDVLMTTKADAAEFGRQTVEVRAVRR